MYYDEEKKMSILNRVPMIMAILLVISVGVLIFILFFNPFAVKTSDIEMSVANTYLLKTENDLTYEIDDESIITMDADGKVTAHKEGVANLTVKDEHDAIVKIYKFIVKESDGGNIELTEVSFEVKKLKLNAGDTSIVTIVKKPANSDEKLIWQSTDESVAIVDSSGNVKGVGEGIASITVSGKLSGIVATVEVEVTGNIKTGNKTIKLNKSTATLGVKETVQLTAEVTPASNEAIKWTTSNKKVATVDKGLVTTHQTGAAIIKASLSDGSSATAIIEVTDDNVSVKEVRVNVEALNVEIGQTVMINASVEPSNATDKSLIWKSDDEGIATVSSGGAVVGKKEGTTTITVTSNNGKHEASVKVTVINYDVTDIKLNTAPITLTAGGSHQLSFTLSPNNAKANTVTWTTSNQGVATINGGTIKAVNPGTARITATLKNGMSVSVDVTVKAVVVANIEVASVDITVKNKVLYKGDSYQFAVTINPSNATNKAVTWSSSNTAVATVTGNGMVKGVGAGTTNITVRTVNGKVSTVSLTVIEDNATVEVTHISTSSDQVYVKVGASSLINAAANPMNATDKTLTWTSENTSIATVASNGLVTGKQAGTTKVIITANNGKIRKEVVVTVSAN